MRARPLADCGVSFDVGKLEHPEETRTEQGGHANAAAPVGFEPVSVAEGGGIRRNTLLGSCQFISVFPARSVSSPVVSHLV